MSYPSPIKLSVLRDIGWSEWDPIGLTGIEGGWKDSNAADEYDRYLLETAGRLQSGEPESALVDFLVSIEARHMGLTAMHTAQARAEATVAAIRMHLASIG